ncbi:hypothetical protein [Sulfurimonas sp.]|uniref:hypothetical protein n=1 Tax=Sulfurimonas sp. TaxID=2022749 RepID=UPI003D139DDB
MNEGLEKLRVIGTQKIYERTHIPTRHVQAILHESYDGLNKVQFIGFVSILEREYGLDLNSVKLKGINYFDDHEQEEEDESIFIQTKPKTNRNGIYIIISVVIFLVVLFSFYGESKSSEKPVVTENEIIQKVKEKVVEEVNETNSTEVVETNSSEINATDIVEEQPLVQEEVVEKSFVIKTKKKLWIGYIELETNKKRQTIFSKEFTLDPNKDWLITLGHGYVDFEVSGKEYNYTTQEGLKFLYKDGELKKISLLEFKRLNRGYAW